MKRVISKKVYDTETADRIATNDYSDGSNQYNVGRTSSLFRTKKVNYFEVNLTCWQGEHNTVTPLSQIEAIEIYEIMYNQDVEFEDAFPDVEISEA